MELMEIIKRAKAQLSEATGLDPLTVPGGGRDGNGGWNATVEMVEFRRIPDAQDIIGAYQVHLNNDGDLLEWQRIGTRKRGDTEWGAE